jgi:hypothetical protein
LFTQHGWPTLPHVPQLPAEQVVLMLRPVHSAASAAQMDP